VAPFDEKDDLDSYLHRFERYAALQGWSKINWAIYVSALLRGKALDVYARLPSDQAQNYDILKQALLKRYALTEEGYKQKFYESKEEKGESPQQFIIRLGSYFCRWLELAGVEQTFAGATSLMVRERYYATCPKSLELFLKERAVTELEELGKLAEQYEDAHGAKSSFRQELPSYRQVSNVQDNECHEQVQAMVQNNQMSFGGQQASYRHPMRRQYTPKQDRRNTAISETNRQEQSSGQPEPNENHEVPL